MTTTEILRDFYDYLQKPVNTNRPRKDMSDIENRERIIYNFLTENKKEKGLERLLRDIKNDSKKKTT
jgi:hypothetical protein